MSTIKRSTKRIGTVVLGLSFYALMIVQCASQTSDSVSVPRAAWEKLENAIHRHRDLGKFADTRNRHLTNRTGYVGQFLIV